jgi:general nucleoside transport system permease protein
MSTDIEPAADVATPPPSTKPKPAVLARFEQFDAKNVLLVPILAVVSALVVGALIVGVTDIERLKDGAFGAIWANILDAYKALFAGAFGSWSGISETLVFATPLMLTGLAVALSFRSGLFNIGATGQMLMGGLASVYVGFSMHGPGIVQIPLAILAGVAAGAVWGGIIGLLKARTGAHEVITTIMANYIAAYLAVWLLKTTAFKPSGSLNPISKTISVHAQLPKLMNWLQDGLRANIGFLIAIAAAVWMWWLFSRSKLGFELRTVGTNPDAARYAGMKIGALTIIAMGLSGGLAGLAGAVKVLGTTPQVTSSFAGDIGFDAIAVALLGRNTSSGTVFAAILFGALEAGKTKMQLDADVPLDLVFVIRALIVLFIAAPMLTRMIWRVKARDTSLGLNFRGWGS